MQGDNSSLSNSQLLLLQRTSVAITTILEPEAIGCLVVEAIEELLPVRRSVAIYVRDKGGLRTLAHTRHALNGSVVSEDSPEKITELLESEERRGIVRWVLDHAESLRIADVRRDPRYVEFDPEVRSELCVPICATGVAIGAINMESERIDGFDEHDQAVLGIVANQLAASLSNARVHREAQEEIRRREHTEAALSHTKELFLKAFRNSPDAIVINEVESGVFIEVNDSFERISGYSRGEVIGRPASELGFSPNQSQLVEFMDEFLSTGRVSQTEIESRTRDEQELIVSCSAERIDVQGRDCMVSVCRDITAAKRADSMLAAYQQKLRVLAAELTVAEERVRRQTAIELHDGLCQKITAAIIRLDLAHQSPNENRDADVLASTVKILKSALHSAREIVDDLSYQQLHELGLEPALAALARDVKRRHGFHCRIDDDQQDKVVSEHAQIVLFRSVNELLTNISKHAGATLAEISIQRIGRNLSIRVTDDGNGFDTAGTDSAPDASGFGLFSIRQQIEALGGNIQLHSSPGSGTSVHLSIPLAAESTRPANATG